VVRTPRARSGLRCLIFCERAARAEHPAIPQDGRLTDSKGRVVNFKNTLIIMTSNVGSSVIEKGGGGLGFQLDTDNEEEASYNRIKNLVRLLRSKAGLCCGLFVSSTVVARRDVAMTRRPATGVSRDGGAGRDGGVHIGHGREGASG
jgi:AAA domain (Cdc48 subfamily)